MAEGTRFKTGYLAPSVSYAQIGKEMGESIRLSIQDIYDRNEQRRARLNATYGLTKAMEEAVPAGVAAKYRQGGQMLLEKMQDASARAYQTQNQSDVDEYLRLKGEFVQFRNIASAKSAMDGQTRNAIASGSYANLSGTVEENLQLYNQYNQADYTWDDATGTLQVSVGDGYVDWKQSNIANMDDVFIPQTLWAGTDYMPENVGQDIYESLLSGKEDILQVRDERNYAVGAIDSEQAYSLISENITSRLRTRTPEMLEAIQAVGYKTINRPHSAELSQKDIADAAELYNGAVMFDTVLPDGRNISSGKLNANGEWVFDVSDEELKANGDYDNEMRDTRNALKVYLESAAERAYNLINVKDETAVSRRQAMAEIPDAPEPEPTYSPIGSFLGSFSLTDGETGKTVTEDRRKVKASVEGRKYRMVISGEAIGGVLDAQGKKVDESTLPSSGDIKVEVDNLIFDNDGTLLGFDLATGPGILEGVIMDISGTPIKSIQVTERENPKAFREVLTSIEQVAAPSKSKRSGAQLLFDAQQAILEENKNAKDKDGFTSEATEKGIAIASRLASERGRDFSDSVFNAVMNAPKEERSDLMIRIFNELEKGNSISIDEDGLIAFD